MLDLMPFQQEGRDWLAARSRGYLADGMGLGKTRQAAMALPAGAKVGIFSPTSAIPHWETTLSAIGLSDAQVLSYAWMARGQRTVGPFTHTIFDEAHYGKSMHAQRTREAFSVGKRADVAWLLSGTPMPNDPRELYAPLYYFWPEILKREGIKSEGDWMRTFTLFQKYNIKVRGRRRPVVKITGVRNRDRLRAILQEIMLRRLEPDVDIQLPELRIDLEYLPPDPQWEARVLAAGGFESLHHTTAGRLVGEYKAPLIADRIADELARGEYRQIVLFARHLSVIEMLRGRLREFGPVVLSGSATATMRRLVLSQFEGGNSRVFIGQNQAAGVGLNLQTASQAVIVEPDWSPNDVKQQIKRVHRIGSKNAVRARMYAVAGSQDADRLSRLAEKIRMAQDVDLGGG